ncbi:MAG: efflux RND transporter periplasmic adaptor subunit [Sterolibacterium sp.]
MSSDPATLAQASRMLRNAGIVIAVIAVTIVVAGIAIRTSEAARLSAQADSQSVPTVVVIKPGSSGAAATLELPGRLEAYSRAPIYARVSGYLKNWKVDIGAPVKSGQLLAEIETPDLDQQLLQAKADLASVQAHAALAASTAKRWQSLLGSDAVSRQESEEKLGDAAAKQAMANAAQANVDRLLATKNFARIVAPFDGIVTARSTDVGALINAGGSSGQELFVVSDTRKLRVYVSVPQNYVSAVKRGAKARISVPEQPGKFYAAQVESSSQAISSTSGSMLTQLSVDNADGALLPGGFTRVSFELARKAGGVSIPSSALIFDKAGLFVATVDGDGKIALKSVTIARDLGNVIELASGLGPDDRLVESPPDGIANGELVHVAVAETATAASASGNDGKAARAQK